MNTFRPLMFMAAMAVASLFAAPMLANDVVIFGDFALEESYNNGLFDMQNKAAVGQPALDMSVFAMAIQSVPPELAPKNSYNLAAPQINNQIFAREFLQVSIQSVAPG